jgi:hypothetical protein
MKLCRAAAFVLGRTRLACTNIYLNLHLNLHWMWHSVDGFTHTSKASACVVSRLCAHPLRP